MASIKFKDKHYSLQEKISSEVFSCAVDGGVVQNNNRYRLNFLYQFKSRLDHKIHVWENLQSSRLYCSDENNIAFWWM